MVFFEPTGIVCIAIPVFRCDRFSHGPSGTRGTIAVNIGPGRRREGCRAIDKDVAVSIFREEVNPAARHTVRLTLHLARVQRMIFKHVALENNAGRGNARSAGSQRVEP